MSLADFVAKAAFSSYLQPGIEFTIFRKVLQGPEQKLVHKKGSGWVEKVYQPGKFLVSV